MPNTLSKKSALSLSRQRIGADIGISLGLSAVILFFIVSGLIAYWNTRILNRDTLQIVHTHEVILGLDNIVSLMKDAETGQRGYVLTGDDKYLKPFMDASVYIEQQMDTLKLQLREEPEQTARLPGLQDHIAAKMAELNETIILRHTKGFDEALAVVKTDRGKNEMDLIRNQAGEMQKTEQDLRSRRMSEMDNAYKLAIASSVLTAMLGVLLSAVVAFLVRRTVRTRQREEWLQSGEVGLNAALAGDPQIGKLADHALKFLAEYLDAHAGVFFRKRGEELSARRHLRHSRFRTRFRKFF